MDFQGPSEVPLLHVFNKDLGEANVFTVSVFLLGCPSRRTAARRMRCELESGARKRRHLRLHGGGVLRLLKYELAPRWPRTSVSHPAAFTLVAQSFHKSGRWLKSMFER
jgi:hypothetical protein